MPKATWKGTVIAESENVELIEGNVYFPPDSVKREHIKLSDTETVCPWKGTASYYNIEVDGDVNKDAAWFYPEPKDAAANLKDYVAFWRALC